MKKNIKNEVEYVKKDIVLLNNNLTSKLIKEASQNSRKRKRICAHKNNSQKIHEMFIVHEKGNYVRPHMHKYKTESMLILEGIIDFIIFNKNGNVKKVFRMGNYSSKLPFYTSLQKDFFHSYVIRSKKLLFLEITSGPFIQNNTIFSKWSPDEIEIKKGLEFLKQKIHEFKK